MQQRNAPQERNAPLTARSVLASTLLGMEPPELPVAQLVHTAGLFGITENTVRVALSRMAASGEAVTDGAGRYRLAGHLLERQRRQRASRAAQTTPWNGTWDLVLVRAPSSSAEARSARRRLFARARLAELREGCWLRPANLELALEGTPGADLLAGSFVPAGDGAALAARLWDLPWWAARAETLRLELAARALGGPEDLAPGFVLSAAVLRHFQADPLLPDGLLAPDWPGAVLRADYDEWDGRYRRLLARWSREGQAKSRA